MIILEKMVLCIVNGSVLVLLLDWNLVIFIFYWWIIIFIYDDIRIEWFIVSVFLLGIIN